METRTVDYRERSLKMKYSKQMSESLGLGILLALSGGFMDAYSYICRDNVFASAQTGNMILLGINLSEGNWSIALRYFFPILAFALGVFMANVVRIKMKNNNSIHWRQILVICEIAVFFCVSLIPTSHNLMATSLISLVCGIQVASFRKIRGIKVATNMCIGNIQKATQNLCEYCLSKNEKAAKKSKLYYGILLCFICGAILGNMAVKLLGIRAILVSVVILCVVFGLMFIDREKE